MKNNTILAITTIFISLFAFTTTFAAPTDDFVTSWTVAADDLTITIPTNSDYTYDYSVDCNGDGTVTLTNQTGDAVCTYTTAGDYTVRISGTFPAIYFNGAGDKDKIKDITQWGTGQWQSFANAFTGALNLTATATDNPNLSASDISMSSMFQTNRFVNPNTTDWNTSNVTDMSGMFNQAYAANPDVSNWDVRKVTSMRDMFRGGTGTSVATPDVSGWQTDSLTDAYAMFFSAEAANPDVSGWDISGLADVGFAFSQSALSTANYDKLLASWSIQDVQSGAPLGAAGRTYCNTAARAAMSAKGWTFTGDTLSATCPTNTAPTVAGLPDNIDPADTDTDLNLSAVVFTDADDDVLTLTLSTTAGTFTATGNTNITILGSTTGTLDISGTPADLHTYLDDTSAVQYTASTAATISATLRDSRTALDEQTITVMDDPDGHFVTKWTTTVAGETITIPTNPAYTYDYNVDCGGGGATNLTDQTGDATCTYTTAGTYTVRISGNFPAIYFNFAGDRTKIREITQWGTRQWESFDSAFEGASSITVHADAGVPDLSATDISMSSMFAGATVVNPDVSAWDTTNVTNINSMFNNAVSANPDVSGWNVSNITSGTSAFDGSAFSNANYEALLQSWSRQSLRWGVTLGVGDKTYCSIASRAVMVARGWTFNSDSLSATCPTNTAPTVTGIPDNLGAAASTATDLDLSAVVFTDTEDDVLTLTLYAIGDTLFTATGDDNITISGSATSTLSISGTPADLHTYLDDTSAVQYTSSAAYALVTTLRDAHTAFAVASINDFVTIWKTTEANETVTIPVNGSRYASGGFYHYTIDCGPTSAVATRLRSGIGPNQNAVCTYPTPADDHEIRISGRFSAIWFNNEGDKDKIQDVTQWGTDRWGTFGHAFYGASNLKVTATDVPNLSGLRSSTRSFAYTFANTSANPDVSKWDTSQVDDTRYMFSGNPVANPDVSQWNTNNLFQMSYMFDGATSANPDVSGWDVSGLYIATHAFRNSGFSKTNYDKLLASWSTQNLAYSGSSYGGLIHLGVSGRTYCNAVARAAIINTRNWVLAGDTASSSCPPNTAPTVAGLPPNIDFVAGTAVDVDLSEVVFTDAEDDIITLTLSAPTGGVFAATGTDTVTIAGIARYRPANVLGISGTPADLHTYLEDASAVQYTASAEGTISATLRDARNSVAAQTITLFDSSDYFITKWTTTTENETITIPTNSEYIDGTDDNVVDAGTYNYNVDCGANASTRHLKNQTGNAVCTYPTAGEHTVRISGDFPAIRLGGSSANSDKLTTIEQWGTMAWQSMYDAFIRASNVVISPDAGVPDLSDVTTLRGMFAYNTALTDQDLSGWDTSTITDMEYTFADSTADLDLSGWDVSAVTKATGMFRDAGLSTVNYDKLLASWSTQDVQSGVTLGATGQTYCNTVARAALITKGWTFISDSLSSEACPDNTAPTVAGIPENIDAAATDTDLDLSEVVFADTEDDILTLTLSAVTAIFTATGTENVTVIGSGTGVLELSATVADLHTYLDDTSAVQYTAPTAGTVSATLRDARNGLAVPSSNDFITVWETTTASETITIPTNSSYTYNYNVDCGGGGAINLINQTGDASCTYDTAGEYTVRISGDFPAIYFNNTGDKGKIKDITQWGTGQWRSFANAFFSAGSLTITASDVPDLSASGISMSQMFQNAFLANPDVSKWDTGNVTNMNAMFNNTRVANPDVSKWDTGNVTDMYGMFSSTTIANPDVSNWDTSKVTDISSMFGVAAAANPDVSGWDVSSVTRANFAFGNSALSTANYDKLLASWSTQDLQSGVTLGTQGRTYCNTNARAAMVAKGWAFDRDGPSTETCSDNAAPTITGLPDTIDAADVDLDLSAVVFVDADDDILTLTLSATTGTFIATGNDTITISGSTTGTLGISGTPGNLHTYLDNTAAVQYASFAAGTISVTLRDVRTTLDEHTITVTADPEGHFVTKWTTTGANETITIPINSSYTYKYSVDCGVNASVRHLTKQTGNAVCTYPTAGDHTVRISGSFPSIRFNNTGDKGKIKDITQWGKGQWESFESAFYGASNMAVNATDAPNLTATDISMNFMFFGASIADPNTTDWNTSNVTQMNSMFQSNLAANPDVSQWDISKITNLSNMFNGATAANPDVSGWDTSKVTNITGLFNSANVANPDVSGWDVSSVTRAEAVFSNSALSTANYDKLLAAWSIQDLQSVQGFGAHSRTYCNTAARAAMIAKGWTPTADSLSSTCPTNTAPTVTGLLENIDAMGTVIDIDLSAAVFVDTDDDVLTLTLSSEAGTFTATGNDNITISGSTTGTLGISGTVEHLHTYLDNTAAVQYTVSAGGNISATLRDARTALAAHTITIVSNNEFVTVWKTTTANETITIPINSSYTYDYTVDCGSNAEASTKIQEDVTGNATCTYPVIGDDHEIRISGDFPAIYFNNTGDKGKIKSVEQWGTGQWESFENAFYGASNMAVNATDAPNLTATDISMSGMFRAASLADPNTTDWNTSNVTDMSSMFFQAAAANPDVSGWNTSQVTDMSFMFNNAPAANPDVSGWNVSEVSNANSMLDASGISHANYDELLASWSRQILKPNIELLTSAQYCNTVARDVMIAQSWTFTGDSLSTSCQTNAAPTVVNLPTTDDILIDQITKLDLSGAVFADADGDVLTLTLSSTTGTFTATGNDNITISGSTTGTLVISGTAANLHTYLDDTAAVQYSSLASGTISATLRDARNTLAAQTLTVVNSSEFVTVWKTTTANETITIPTNSSYTYDYYVDCGVNASTRNLTNRTGNAVCTYPTAGEHTVRISGDFPAITLDGSADRDKLMTIEQWGIIAWRSMFNAFIRASNVVISPDAGAPDLSGVTTMRGMFAYNTALTNQDLSGWDTSTITNMDFVFANSTADIDLSGWDVSAVTTADGLFREAGLSTANYDKLLAGWSAQTLQPSVRLGATGVQYCDTEARAILTGTPNNWIITDGGEQTDTYLCGDQILNLDIDGNTRINAATDGILIARYIAAVRGESLIAGAVAAGGTRKTAEEIEAYLEMLSPADLSSNKLLDIDGNTRVNAATDGILIARYIAAVRGESLIAGAVAAGGTRKTAGEIEAYLANLDVMRDI